MDDTIKPGTPSRAGDARTEVLEAEARWKLAIEATGDGVWDWDVASGRVVFSQAWKSMLGLGDHEVGDSVDEWTSRVHPEDLPRALADLQAYFDGRSATYVNEHRVRCKDGSWKWILDRGSVLTWDADGRPARMIGSHADITPFKDAVALLERRNDELRRFTQAAVDRELRMVELKQEINALARRLGESAPYPDAG